jgi:DNA-directed RNA polymerase specialized sigma24 family protein
MADDSGRRLRALVPGLRRTAYLLCGDWPRADELVRLTLARLAAAGRRPDPASLREELVRRWSAGRSSADAGPAGRPEPVRTLLRMPPRRRACVVLRHWEGCSVEETARLLDCSAAVVRTETTEGLHALLTLRSGSDRKAD